MDDSLCFVLPLLHRKNHIPDFLKAIRDLFPVLYLSRFDQGREYLVKFFVVLGFEASDYEAVQSQRLCYNLNQILGNFRNI